MSEVAARQKATTALASNSAEPHPDNLAALWSELPGLWDGGTRTESFARATEHSLRACQTLLEANQKSVILACDMTWHQQEFAFAAAQATLSALPGTAERTGTVWSRTMAAYADACGHGLDVMRALAAAALAAPQQAATTVANRTGTTG